MAAHWLAQPASNSPTTTCIIVTGDGDGFISGITSFTPCAAMSTSSVAMDNQVWPHRGPDFTSSIGMKTSTPFGSVEGPINPIVLALAAGATFVARGFSGEPKHLTDLMKQGIRHEGFSFIDVFSPCVTYNHDNTYPWFKQRVKKLEDDASYDSSNWTAAMDKARMWGDTIPIGKFFERTDLPSLHGAEPILSDGGPLAHRSLGIAPEMARQFVEELM